MRLTCFALFAVVCCGCSSIEVIYYRDMNEDLSSFKSYRWLPDKAKRNVDSRINVKLVDLYVRGAVNDAFRKMKITKDADGEAAAQVGYQIDLESFVKVDRVNRYYGYAPDFDGGGWQWLQDGLADEVPIVNEYEVGTLIIDIVNPKTRRLAFRGIAKAGVDRSAMPKRKEVLIGRAVKQIMKAYKKSAKTPPRGA